MFHEKYFDYGSGTYITSQLPMKKIEALRFLLKWMPLIDQQFCKVNIAQLKMKKAI